MVDIQDIQTEFINSNSFCPQAEFELALDNGNINACKYIYYISQKEDCNIDINSLFKRCCRYFSNLKSAKYLYELSIKEDKQINSTDCANLFVDCITSYGFPDKKIKMCVDLFAENC